MAVASHKRLSIERHEKSGERDSDGAWLGLPHLSARPKPNQSLASLAIHSFDGMRLHTCVEEGEMLAVIEQQADLRCVESPRTRFAVKSASREVKRGKPVRRQRLFGAWPALAWPGKATRRDSLQCAPRGIASSSHPFDIINEEAITTIT